MKRQYHIIMEAQHGALDKIENQSYAQSSVSAVVKDVLNRYSTSAVNYEPEQFTYFEDQTDGNYAQILKGNALDFLHYQLNLNGIYYPTFDGSGDAINIVPDLRMLPDSGQSYTLNYNEHRNVQSQSPQVLVRSLEQLGKLNPTAGNARYRQYKITENRSMNDPKAEQITDSLFSEVKSYRPDEKPLLHERVQAAVHAFDGAFTLTTENIIQTEGQRFNLISLKGGQSTDKLFWIYASSLKGHFNESKEWEIEGSLTILPYPDIQTAKAADYLWFPGIVVNPQRMTQKVGGRYVAAKPISGRGEIPMALGKPYNYEDQEEAFYTRTLHHSTSPLGGTHTHAQDSGDGALHFIDNDPNHFISTGWVGNSTIPHVVESMKVAHSEIESSGGMKACFKRRRFDTAYSQVGLTSSDAQNRLSGVVVGGLAKDNQQLYHNPKKEYEGVSQHSTSFGLDVTAQNYEHQTGDDNEFKSYQVDAESGMHRVRHESQTDDYAHNYYATPYVTPEKDAKVEAMKPYLSRVSLNTAFSGNNLHTGDPEYQTQLTWRSTPDQTLVRQTLNQSQKGRVAHP
ncbi:hypothetical protein N8865_01925 [Francisellaceae bacterium]|nr:hypothetical protein [Francisellaceae bacterium]